MPGGPARRPTSKQRCRMTKDPEMDGPARASPTQRQPHSSGPIAAPVFFLRIGDSSRLSSPYYGGPRVRIPVPPAGSQLRTGLSGRTWVRIAEIGTQPSAGCAIRGRPRGAPFRAAPSRHSRDRRKTRKTCCADIFRCQDGGTRLGGHIAAGRPARLKEPSSFPAAYSLWPTASRLVSPCRAGAASPTGG